MTCFATTTSLLLIYLTLLTCTLSYYVIDNGRNLRLVSSTANCHEGIVQFYNGSLWGSLTDCSASFTAENAKSICKTLGWETEQYYIRGASLLTTNQSSLTQYARDSHIAYTSFTDCSSLAAYDTCSDCAFIRDLASCPFNLLPQLDLHDQFDIFISCDNYGIHKQSALYECVAIGENDVQYMACDARGKLLTAATRQMNRTAIIVVVCVAIFGSMLCVIVFVLYTRYKEYRSSVVSLQKHRKDGFAVLELHSVDTHKKRGLHRKHTPYVPSPQPRFDYNARSAHKLQSKTSSVDMRDLVSNDNGTDREQEQGYDMDEIIPSVIFSGNNKTVYSESYGLIKNQTDEESDTRAGSVSPASNQ